VVPPRRLVALALIHRVAPRADQSLPSRRRRLHQSSSSFEIAARRPPWESVTVLGSAAHRSARSSSFSPVAASHDSPRCSFGQRSPDSPPRHSPGRSPREGFDVRDSCWGTDLAPSPDLHSSAETPGFPQLALEERRNSTTRLLPTQTAPRGTPQSSSAGGRFPQRCRAGSEAGVPTCPASRGGLPTSPDPTYAPSVVLPYALGPGSASGPGREEGRP
jgi:hypothetical protein